MEELEHKRKVIEELLTRHGLEALFLRRISSFAWATGGAASYINTAAGEGVASLFIAGEKRFLITDNIEATRLEEEEELKEQGWEFLATPWHAPGDALAELGGGMKVGADVSIPGAVDLSADMAHLRARLTPAEGARLRELGLLCAEAMQSAALSLSLGMAEYEIAALLAEETQKRGVQPIVNLIATDERIFRFRHPLPTSKKLDRYAMLVLCGRRQGLVCSLTRLVHFGRLPDELRRKAEALAVIDAAFIAATRPGRTVGDVLDIGIASYGSAGFPDEWQLHHQGGPAGYEPREHLATPGSDEVVVAGQAYAWNPSITGTKSEDTILVGQLENEVITSMAGWPVISVVVDGQEYRRPAIYEI